jgi:hypothetical protein
VSVRVSSRELRPRFESRAYRPSPARREHIHGRIQPMTTRRTCGLQIISNAIMLGLFAVVVVLSAAYGWRW